MEGLAPITTDLGWCNNFPKAYKMRELKGKFPTIRAASNNDNYFIHIVHTVA
jgi:hypothetical protein